jgi:predicted GH43/DUF377 family glycosyl hydrolase
MKWMYIICEDVKTVYLLWEGSCILRALELGDSCRCKYIPLETSSFAQQYKYEAVVTGRAEAPALSIANPKGKGYSPCGYTFNPGWLPSSTTNDTKALVILRVANCPAQFGGSGDHLILATCYTDGHCDDVTTPQILPFESGAEDPRIAVLNGWYYLFYYANGVNQSTVYLRKTKTPADLTSWQRVGPVLPWHRNGCVLIRPSPPHYVIFGEAPPLPGVGIASTPDIETFKTLNAELIKPNGAANVNAPEIVIEASTPVVQLSTGDYFHIYSAGTPGWVANGNYTAGWIVLDKTDPTIVKQRSATHFFSAEKDYEGVGKSIYPVQRNRTLFPTSLIPTGKKDEFRVWYGAADASVASAIVQVTYTTISD